MISVFTFCRTRLWCKFGLPAEYPPLIWIHSWSETAFMTVIWFILQNSVQRSHIDSHLHGCFNSCKRSKLSSNPHPATTSVSHYTIPPQKFLVHYIQRRIWDSSRISPNLCSILLLVGHKFTDLRHDFYLLVISIVNLQKNDSLYKKIRGVVTLVSIEQ